eukprot:m.25027 g.25027  ORF g.25027 m.25027 type:complete len:545 (-) comp5723_c1_seq1:164-1798(-)
MEKDPFFASAGKSKRKARKPTKFQRKTKREKREDVIGTEENLVDSDVELPSDNEEDRDETIVKETAAERRVRMAKDVIHQIEEQEREKQLDGELLNDAVAHRLRQEVDKEKGMLRRELAKRMVGLEVNSSDKIISRGHRLPVTSVAISNSMEYFVTASKDGTIIKWSIGGIKVHVWMRRTRNNHYGHQGAVLCVAIDDSNKYLATGGDDAMINIWDFNTHAHVKCFRGHRRAVNGLVFRKKSLQLYSASDDRTLKVWNADALTYVETLYGHQDTVLAVGALHRERALSCGGRDRSLRLWKIVEESQLVYSGSGVSMDCLTMVSEFHFVTGNQNGSISLWDMNKKKAVSTRSRAHGANNWISAVAAVPYADIFASGSRDGFVRVWSIGEKNKHNITPLFSIPENGWINSLAFSHDGTMLVAGVGKEHRLGRWDVQKEAKNGGRVYTLLASEDDEHHLKTSGVEHKEEIGDDEDEDDDEEIEDDDDEEGEEDKDDYDGGKKSSITTHVIKGPTRIMDDDNEDEDDEELEEEDDGDFIDDDEDDDDE